MENSKTQSSSYLGSSKIRISKKILLILIIFILLITLLLIANFFSYIITISSFKKISDAPAYQMTYHGEYALDEYLEQGATSANELRSFLADNLAQGAAKLFVGDHGCSTFFGTTPDGDYILARNFDSFFGKGCILRTDETEGNKIIGLANAEWLFDKQKKEFTFADQFRMAALPYVVTDGMNEYGLTVAFLTASGTQTTKDDDKITLYDPTIPMVLLNKAKTVNEVVSLLSKYNVSMDTYPSHYMVCDASGNSAIIEFVNGEMQVIYNDKNYQICSNFILYDNPELRGYGSDRYKNYDSVLSKTNGIITVEDALKLLQENTIPGDELWSVVYNLTDKTISATFYGDYDNVYEYSFQ